MEKNEKEEKKIKKFSKGEEDAHRLSQFFHIPKFMFKMHLNFFNHYFCFQRFTFIGVEQLDYMFGI